VEFEYNLDNLKKASQFILNNSKSNILLFSGVVGAGKTTLIKQLCKDLGVLDVVNSPSYSIINEYKTEEKPVFHMDLFRLKKEELNNLGLIDYLTGENKTIIEWPEIIINELDESYCYIKIDYNKDNMRKLKLINTI
jgi:tRNA threonylcarbamoyladenosine biosynthesis protein TsaE